jgi:flagellar L-ring protein precursor FlgH
MGAASPAQGLAEDGDVHGQVNFLEGRVRPQDISDGNVVVSSRLADAKITYVGQGDLAERQKPAWWRKVFDWLGL